MNMKWRLPLAAALAASMVVTLGGCSGSNQPASEKNVTLALVAAGDTLTAYNAEVKRFNESQKGIHLAINTYPSGDAYNQALTGQVAGGSAPDIFLLDTGNQTDTFAKAGAIKPLDDLIKTAGIDVSSFAPNLVASGKYNGKLYAVPKDYSTTALFYHKSDLQAAGATPPTSWSELRAAAKAMTKNGRFGLGMYPQINYFLAWIQAFGGNFVDSSGKISNFVNPGHVAAIQEMLSLFITDKSAATPQMTGASWDGEMFAKNQVGMVFGGTWIPGGISGTAKDDVGVLALPNNTMAGSVLYAAGWTIYAKSKNPDAAAQVIKFLTSDNELVAAHNAGIILIPPKASALKELTATGGDPVLTIAEQTAQQGVPFGLLDPKFVDKYNGMLASLVAGNNASESTVTDALNSLASQLNLK